MTVSHFLYSFIRGVTNSTYMCAMASSNNTRLRVALTSLYPSSASSRVLLRLVQDFTGMYLASPSPRAKWQYRFTSRLCSTVSSMSWGTQPHTVSTTLVLSLNCLDRDTAEYHSCAEGDLLHFYPGNAHIPNCTGEIWYVS